MFITFGVVPSALRWSGCRKLLCSGMMETDGFVALSGYCEYPPEEMLLRARELRQELSRRRSVRHFARRAVQREVIEECLRAAATAPSGANLQPWRFVVVSDGAIKRRIREAAEAEEREFYERRAPPQWLAVLEPLGTDARKPYLEEAPYLVAIFGEKFRRGPSGERFQNYYVQESVGIATGLLIAALHHAGLVCLTHTPSPMGFLNEVLGRPDHERPFLLLVVGYPAEDALVPEISKKELEEIVTFL